MRLIRLGMRAAAVAAVSACWSEAGPLPLPDCIFDGVCSAGTVKPAVVLRVESRPIPAAPRFAIDPKAVPEGMLRVLPGYESLPHKNQEESAEWVSRMNDLIRARNARSSSHRIREWVADGRPNQPPFACLSYGISTVMDWWSLQCGADLQSYQSSVHGGAERGWDPRVFELEYFYRASFRDDAYVLFSKQLPIDRDPVRLSPVPYAPLGYAEIAVERRSYANPDPYTGATYAFDAGRGPMEGEYLRLFSNSVLAGRTKDRNARVLAQALDKWGIAYVQTEEKNHPRFTGSHTLAAVGYFCMDMAGSFLPCDDNKEDEDWAESAYFVLHDSFGDFPIDKVRDSRGGSAYIATRIDSLDEAFVFPHSFLVTAEPVEGRPGHWNLRATNRCGKPVEVSAIQPLPGDGRSGGYSVVEMNPRGALVAGLPGAVARLSVAARHYFEADGMPRTFEIALGSGKTEGRELRRTPALMGFYERHHD